MKVEKLIFNKFKNSIVAYNENNENEMLFKSNIALEVVDELERVNAVILGLDFWQFKDNDYLQVNSTAWDDLSQGNDASQKTIRETRALLKSTLSENEEFISFVLKEQEVSDH